MLLEHERGNELTKASSDASLRNQLRRAGFVVRCGAAGSALRALGKTCVLPLIHLAAVAPIVSNVVNITDPQ